MRARRTISVFLIATAVSCSSAIAQELKKIKIVHALPQLSASFANDSSLPAYLGFWKAEGLDVEVLTTPGAAAAMQLVVGKQAEIGVVNAFSSMLARQRGAKVKSYYTSLRGDIFGIALPKDTGLTSLADQRQDHRRFQLRQWGLDLRSLAARECRPRSRQGFHHDRDRRRRPRRSRRQG